jgi:hypothetical protein
MFVVASMTTVRGDLEGLDDDDVHCGFDEYVGDDLGRP